MEPMKSIGVFFQRAAVYRPPVAGTRILPNAVHGTFTRFMLPTPKPAKPIPPEK
jgi:hypothetical protein